ncbi:MAG: hypothetical protein R3A10_08655 [Caldilineaceae bacterium]
MLNALVQACARRIGAAAAAVTPCSAQEIALAQRGRLVGRLALGKRSRNSPPRSRPRRTWTKFAWPHNSTPRSRAGSGRAGPRWPRPRRWPSSGRLRP